MKTKGSTHAPLIERVMRKSCILENGCVVWTGAVKDGYGNIGAGGQFGRHVRTHQVMYEHFIGPVPEGLELDHLCRNRLCMAPAHLEAVTHQENVLRGEGLAAVNARKTHCDHGHEFTPENTFLSNGRWRGCIACRRRRQSVYDAKRRRAE